MSTFLAFESALVPGGTTPDDFKTLIRNSLSSRGWQIIAESILYTSVLSGAASGSWASVANAFNDDTYNTGATITGTFPYYIGFNLSGGFTPVKMFISAGSTTTRSPKSFTLDYSDNGSAWTTHQTFNEYLWYSYEKRGFTITGAASHPYWRINITSVMDGQTACEILELMLEDSNGRIVSNVSYFYAVPPIGESLGNSLGRDVFKFTSSVSGCSFSGASQLLTAKPQMGAFWEKTAGAVPCAIGISGPDSTNFNITASVSGTTLTVTNTPSTIFVGMLITHANLPPGTYISTLGTGTGGNGTYILSVGGGTIASTTFVGYGSQVSITGGAGNTAKQNLRALYEAIRDSSDTNFTDWKWSYQQNAPQNANDAGDYIYAIRNTLKANIYTVGNTNINYPTVMSYSLGLWSGYNYAPMLSPSSWTMTGNVAINNVLTMNTDYINGFIYYLQINSRSLCMATKTNVAYYGGIHACFSDHTRAINSIPKNARYLTPIELFVGYDGASSSLTSAAYAAHGWKIPYSVYTAPASWSAYAWAFGGGQFRDEFNDHMRYDAGNQGVNVGFTLYGSNIFVSADTVGDDFQVHRMGTSNIDYQSSNYSSFGSMFIPASEIQDWYKFRGTGTNESLLLVADTVAVTTLSGALDGSTTPSTITLADGSGFQSSGYLVIENELIQYTGKSGNVFSGISRAKYGTIMVKHYDSEIVSQGLWMTVINGSALFCGYVKPS